MNEPLASPTVVGYVLIGCGLLTVIGAYRDVDEIVATGNSRVRLVHGLLGRRWARVFHLVGGVFVMVLGAFIVIVV